jgi:hypothetical protein
MKANRPFRVETEMLTAPQIIDAKNCNAIRFINQGDGAAQIDGISINATEYLTDSDETGEGINQTKYNVTFDSNPNRKICISRKYYI